MQKIFYSELHISGVIALFYFTYFILVRTITLSLLGLLTGNFIDLIEEKCSTKELLLFISYFWSYCPLLFFKLHSCSLLDYKGY